MVRSVLRLGWLVPSCLTREGPLLGNALGVSLWTLLQARLLARLGCLGGLPPSSLLSTPQPLARFLLQSLVPHRQSLRGPKGRLVNRTLSWGANRESIFLWSSVKLLHRCRARFCLSTLVRARV